MSEATEIIPTSMIPSTLTDLQVEAIQHGAKLGDAVLDRPPASMSDRELWEETLIIQRRTRDTVQEFISGLSDNPMIGALMQGKSPLGAMFGRQ